MKTHTTLRNIVKNHALKFSKTASMTLVSVRGERLQDQQEIGQGVALLLISNSTPFFDSAEALGAIAVVDFGERHWLAVLSDDVEGRALYSAGTARHGSS